MIGVTQGHQQCHHSMKYIRVPIHLSHKVHVLPKSYHYLHITSYLSKVAIFLASCLWWFSIELKTCNRWIHRLRDRQTLGHRIYCNSMALHSKNNIHNLLTSLITFNVSPYFAALYIPWLGERKGRFPQESWSWDLSLDVQALWQGPIPCLLPFRLDHPGHLCLFHAHDHVHVLGHGHQNLPGILLYQRLVQRPPFATTKNTQTSHYTDINANIKL